jgi:hypothetical protein
MLLAVALGPRQRSQQPGCECGAVRSREDWGGDCDGEGAERGGTRRARGLLACFVGVEPDRRPGSGGAPGPAESVVVEVRRNIECHRDNKLSNSATKAFIA